MSEQAVLSATGLTKTFSDGQQTITVLEDLNLQVSAGEWLAIVGASGAGKSTLLNLLGGLDLPTAGEIAIAGTALPALSELERSRWRNQRLGFVFQMHHLLPEFSALESVAMPARIGGMSKVAAEARRFRFVGSVGPGTSRYASPCGTIWRRAPARRHCARPDQSASLCIDG